MSRSLMIVLSVDLGSSLCLVSDGVIDEQLMGIRRIGDVAPIGAVVDVEGHRVRGERQISHSQLIEIIEAHSPAVPATRSCANPPGKSTVAPPSKGIAPRVTRLEALAWPVIDSRIPGSVGSAPKSTGSRKYNLTANTFGSVADQICVTHLPPDEICAVDSHTGPSRTSTVVPGAIKPICSASRLGATRMRFVADLPIAANAK